MSCNACQTKFTFFTRENGCPNCGYSYCSKCLKYKHELSNGMKKVCGPCHNKLMAGKKENSQPTSSESSPNEEPIQPFAPVDIERKLNSLDNPTKPPIVIYKKGRWDSFKSGLDPVDQEIVDRLRKLKDEDKQPPPPTTDEIRRRLALLKDLDPDRNVPVNVNSVDTRSDQEKTDDLIRQYLERLELSSPVDGAEDIQKRLNALKGIDPSKSSQQPADEEEDEETQTKNIIQKAMAEAALTAQYQDEDELQLDMEMEIDSKTAKDSDEELSCCMCEQTKDLVECRGCTGDLYCPICFEDNHDEFELKKHKAVPFERR